jgi:hypothetical protein
MKKKGRMKKTLYGTKYVGRTRRQKRRKCTEKVPRRVKKRENRKVRQLIDLKGLCHEMNFC